MSTSPATHLLLIGTFLPGPGGRAASDDLATELRRRGWRITMASRLRPKSARAWDMVRTTWQSRRTCALAIVDLYSGPASVWAMAVCAVWRGLARRPYVLILHGGSLPRFAARWPRIVGCLLRSAAAVTSPSRYLQQEMSRYRSDIQLIPNGIPVPPPPAVSGPIGPDLLWVRSFHAIYNPVMAVRVLAAVKARHPEATLTMLGPDKGDGSLEATRAEAERLGVTAAVTFTGPVPKADVGGWLARHRLFINTTNVDNTPVSVIEAMAAGLCVVSTNVGGLPYLVEHGVDGLLVDRDDAAAMAAAIDRLIAEPAAAAALSARALRKAATFDWSVVIPQWLQLLARLDAAPAAEAHVSGARWVR